MNRLYGEPKSMLQGFQMGRSRQPTTLLILMHGCSIRREPMWVADLTDMHT